MLRGGVGVVGWEPDIVGVEQGTMREGHSTVGDIEMGHAANKAAEERGTMDPLREEDKAYIIRQKRLAGISYGMNKRQKLDILGGSLVKEVVHDVCGEWVTQLRGTMGSSLAEGTGQSRFSFGAAKFPTRVLDEPTTAYMEENKTGEGTVMENIGVDEMEVEHVGENIQMDIHALQTAVL